MSSIRWPRHLNPIHVAHLIRLQKNPITALYIFNEAKTRFPTTYHHNGPVYATIISILASSNHLTHMKHVLYQMKSDSCQCKDSTFDDAIRAFAKAGRLDDAIELFASIPQFNCVNWTRSFNMLLQIMLLEGDLENAYSLYLENSNRWEVKMGIQSFNLLVAALCRMNRSDLALRVFVEMTEQCCCPDRDTYRILMKGLCDDGRLDDAVHLLYSMFWRISQKGCGADVVVYRILLEVLCDRGEFEEAERILGKVLRKGLKAPKRWCRVPDLGADFAGHGSLDAVKGLINDALVTGGVPSLASYSAVVVDLYSEGKIEDAGRLFDEMCERGFRPSVLMYEAKIAALCQDGRVGDAAKVVEEEMMEKNCVPTVRTYNAVMGGLCKAGMSMQAVGYLERMGRQLGCVADQTTYEILVNGLCREGRFIEAGRIMERMVDRRCWPCKAIFNRLISGLCMMGRQLGCVADQTTYEILVNGLCCEGRFIEAGRIMERMVDRRCWPCKAIFNRLISGLCMMGRRYEAVLWLEEMVSQGKTPEVFVWNSLVAAFCCEADCVELLPEMILEED